MTTRDMALPNYSATPVQMRKYSQSLDSLSIFYVYRWLVGGGIFKVFFTAKYLTTSYNRLVICNISE